MFEQRIDRRTQRTRSALMAAFVDLVLSRSYEEVTVEDIAARADVGRSTFYMHYAGKEGMLRQSMRTPSVYLADIVGSRIPRESLIPILEHFREQRRINAAFFAGPIRSVWIESLAEMIEVRLDDLSRKKHAHPVVPRKLIARQIAEAQIALVAHWLVGGVSCRPEAMAEALVLSTRAITSALLRTGA
jgi:AcrR family transcriptional regulator